MYQALPMVVKAKPEGSGDPVEIVTNWAAVVKQACLQSNMDTLAFITGVCKHNQSDPRVIEDTIKLLGKREM